MNKNKQRETIISYFETYPTTHPSAEEVYEYAKKIDAKIGIATVYRHLKRMVEEGLIGELNFEKQGVHYDWLDHEHYHFICDKCNAIENLECISYTQFDGEVEEITQGKVLRKSFIFHGICKKCLKKSSSLN